MAAPYGLEREAVIGAEYSKPRHRGKHDGILP
jgi:hypothetical protein